MGAFYSSRLELLREGFEGALIDPGHADYDAARVVFNAMIDKRPAVIAQCASNADVQSAIRFAREQELQVAVRGGGHSVAGSSQVEGGLVIDLRTMNAVSVDSHAGVATVAGGATMSHLDRGTQPFGLATTGGRVSTTGVGGFTLGGGSGWLDRKFGLACDNLLSAQVVTASGEIVTASATEHADLFWALHGGGGNFGVVTSVQLKLYPLDRITGGLLLFSPSRAPAVIQTYRDYMAGASDDVGGGAVFLTGPEADFVPQPMQGKLVLALIIVFAGPESAARAELAPILALGHEGEMLAEVPYADFQCMFDDPPGYRNYWSAEYLGALPDAAIETYCAAAARMIVPSPSQHVLFAGGGKVARETADWPVPWRRAPWCFHPFGLWSDPADDQRAIDWARTARGDLKQWATGDVYLNFIGDEGEDRVVAGLGRGNYARLAGIKAQYDPDNVFRLNHNIRPAARAAE